MSDNKWDELRQWLEELDDDDNVRSYGLALLDERERQQRAIEVMFKALTAIRDGEPLVRSWSDNALRGTERILKGEEP